jgi:AcrR family transcriptional regulator
MRLNQEERSGRSRRQILHAALTLFSSQGYRATSMRDIARAADVSTGNVYHQFPDKETIFRSLLDEYWQAIESPDFPFNRALAAGAFPSDLEALGRAARDSVAHYRSYVALIYVDVVEFEGSHIRRFYADMARRFETFLEANRARLDLDRLRPGVSPRSAVMLASRFLLHYFAVEIIFGVPNHFGSDTDTVLKEIGEIFAHGMLRRDETGEAGTRSSRRTAPVVPGD